jgi:hypothetical protein
MEGERMHPKDAPNASAKECLREILDVLTCIHNGYFTCRLPENMAGDAGEIAKVVNAHLDLLEAFRAEHLRLMEEVGVTGRLGGQIALPDCTGAWREMADATNRLGVNMTCQFRDGGNVIRDQLRGETSSRMTSRHIAGEFRQFRETFNELLDRTAARTTAPAP